MPTFAAKYALLVVVAPPEIVRPPDCVPLPMVVEASERRPPENVSVVVVAFDGNGYANVGSPNDEVATHVGAPVVKLVWRMVPPVDEASVVSVVGFEA